MSSSMARNIATEGRSLPSLRQLDEAVRAFLAEHPAEQLTVVVDATFGHRIDASERDEFEAARPRRRARHPAGRRHRPRRRLHPPDRRQGRRHRPVERLVPGVPRRSTPWLFDEGRLIGGKPVPGVGWVFLLRTPVRGPASRRAVTRGQTGPRHAIGTRRRRRGHRRPPRGRGSGRRPTATRRPATGEPRRRPTPAGREPRHGRARRGAPSTPASLPSRSTTRCPFIEFVGATIRWAPTSTAIVEHVRSHGAYVAGRRRALLRPAQVDGRSAPRSARDVHARRRDAHVHRALARHPTTRHRPRARRATRNVALDDRRTPMRCRRRRDATMASNRRDPESTTTIDEPVKRSRRDDASTCSESQHERLPSLVQLHTR